MIRFLIDEDMPRSTASALRGVGVECYDVREVGLKGTSDQDVFKWAQREGCVILTEDLGFSNTLKFPLGSHKGIVVARLPSEMSTKTMNDILINAITEILEDLPNNLTIIEPDRIRIRRSR